MNLKNVLITIQTMLCALKKKVNNLEKQQNRNFELIEEIKITEENIAVIQRTQEPDGTPYNFEKIVYKINCPTASDVIRFCADGRNLGYFSGFNGTNKYADGDCRIENGMLFSHYRQESSNEGATAALRRYGTGLAILETSFNSVEFNINSGSFPLNTTFRIYGLRK